MSSPSEKDLEQRSLLQQALYGLREQRAKLEAMTGGPVAVIGMGCRFPGGADTVDDFWSLLRDGRHGICEVPPDRWDIDALYDPDPDKPGTMYTRYGAFLDQIDTFDARFFEISPREARSMDPQQRLLLEVAWEGLEHAGQSPFALRDSLTGLYIGVSAMDYSLMQVECGALNSVDAYDGTGNAHSVIPGRLSYFLGLRGPCMAVDTACSSSLVAVHLACQALRLRECNLALAGGVNVILSPTGTLTFCKARMLAPDGRCKTFDAAADGYTRGEGCGIVVLKRLRDAIEAGDLIWGVIRGSAVNQDGASAGLTVPHGPAQTTVIRKAMSTAGVAPDEVGYVEAHGTGTSLGDPIEMRALGNAIGRKRDGEEPLVVGSVKTNIGHLESAAGVAGLIKTVLAVHHGQIPPNLHYRTLNPYIAADPWPFVIPTKPTAWPNSVSPRVAGVSSFAFNGTNAHVIVEQAPESSALSTTSERSTHVWCLSARSEEALHGLGKRYQAWMDEHPSCAVADVCHTTNSGRAHLPHRAAVVVSSRDEMMDATRAFSAGEVPANAVTGHVAEGAERPRLVFLFTGQGAQYPGMSRALYETQPVFRDALDRCAAGVQQHLEKPLLDVLFPDADESPMLNHTAYTQPAMFSVEYALAELWQAWGVVPDAVLGHSLGEYAAACAAGVLPVDDALTLVAERARLMGALPAGGAMAAVIAEETSVRDAVAAYAGAVEIAVLNGPRNTVVSGDEEAVESLLGDLDAQGITGVRLPVSHAFHSHRMEPMLEEFQRIAEDVSFSAPSMDVFSNLTGRVAGPADLNQAVYWRRHIREPVQFAECLRNAAGSGRHVFLEIGPGTTLIGLGKKILPRADAAWLCSLRRGQDEWQRILDSVAQSHVEGVSVDWEAVDRPFGSHKVALPTYPFERQRHWIAHADGGDRRRRSAVSTTLAPQEATHPLLGSRVPSPLPDIQFQQRIDFDVLAFFRDHQVFDQIVLPASAYLESALAGAMRAYGPEWQVLREVAFLEPALIGADEPLTFQLVLSAGGEEGAADFRLYSRGGDPLADGEPAAWRLHAQGIVSRSGGLPTGVEESSTVDREVVIHRCPSELDVEAFYGQVHKAGIDYGPAFRGIDSIRCGRGEALGRLQLPPEASMRGDPFSVHPALLDAAFQLVMAAGMCVDGNQGAGEAYLPFALKQLQVHGPLDGPLWGHATIEPAAGKGDAASGRLVLFDENGRIVLRAEGLMGKRVDRDAVTRRTRGSPEDWLYRIAWRPVALTPAGLPVDWIDLPVIANRLRERIGPIRESCSLDQYRDLVPQLDHCIAGAVVHALQVLQWTPKTGDSVTPDGLMESLNVESRHARLLGRLLDILAEDGILRPDGSGWIVESVPTPAFPSARFDELAAAYPDCATEITMARDCGQRLADVLRGTCDPLELLFPGGSADRVEQLYRDAPFAQALNTLAREAVETMMAQAPERRVIRILEIGAGTGGTTTQILPLLPPDRVHYVFTDVSRILVDQSRLTFSGFDSLRCKVLDVEQDPVPQGFDPHSFDVVIAANVLHATRDLRESLATVKRLMAPEAVLMMIEGTGPQPLLDIIFGLTEGWWRFGDTDLRPSYPLLAAEPWLDLLEEQGFRGMTATPCDEDLGSDRPHQTLILAQGPRDIGREEQTHPDRSDPAWLLLTDRGGVGDRLAASLKAAGQFCVCVTGDDGRGDEEDIKRIVQEQFGSPSRTCRGVVHLWSLDETGLTSDPDALLGAMRETCGSVLAMVQAIQTTPGVRPRFWLVTAGAQSVSSEERGPLHVTQSPMWGLGKVIRLEHPDLHCSCIDADPAAGIEEQTTVLFDELHAEAEECEIAYRDGRRLAARVTRVASAAYGVRPGDAQPVRLRMTERGALDNFALEAMERREPSAGEVEIRVHVAGLNFLDVLGALNTLPFQLPGFGAECAGEIVRVGPGVEELQAGDAVVAIAPESFADFTTTHAVFVQKCPETLPPDQAATLPIAYITAYHCLYGIAGLRSGERVLIHAAAGGVGLAAVQLAQHVGAAVFATAGSDVKRDHLRSLGVEAIGDSRSHAFAEQVMEWTAGEGVDVVLNSLTDDFIPQSLHVLRDGGRFVEIGKRGIWDPERVAQLRPGITYRIYDLIEECRERPLQVRETFRSVIEMVEGDAVGPLPHQVFALTDASAAFRHMAQGNHLGKIVFKLHGSGEAGAQIAPTIRRDGTYLITGGWGGLGLRFARWLIEQGAGSLVLAGRGSPAADALSAIRELERMGATVAVRQSDVADHRAMRQLFDEMGQSLPPLRGVIHAAGELDDGVLLQQTWSRFEKVMAPKVVGAWLLHQLTHDRSLDFFVLFSSSASFLGSPGQGNHAAANAFLDALSHYRRRRGLPALSINWGAWSQIGAAARRGVGARIAIHGIGSIPPADGVAAFERAMLSAHPQVAVVPIDWPVFAGQWPVDAVPPALRELATSVTGSGSAATKAAPLEDLRRQLSETPAAEREQVVLEFVTQHVVRVLGLDTGQTVDVREPLHKLGLDSLMAVELRNAFGAMGQEALPVTLLFDYPTIEAVAGYLGREVLQLEEFSEAPAADTEAADDTLLAEAAHLSEAELDAELEQLIDEQLSANGE